MAWKIIRVLPLLFQLLYCSLSQEECSSSTSKSPEIGELLELDCSCGGLSLDWFYSSNRTSSTERQVYSGGPNERSYTFVVQNVSLGGRYRCVCGSCQTECSECFSVSVTATLTIKAFSIKPSIARVNDTLTMTCNATGYEPQFQLTKAGNATMVISELTRTETGVVTAVTATPEHNGMFYCLVLNDYNGYDITSASVVVYVPPAIDGIQNYTVTDYSQPQTATLECHVTSQSSTDYVRWIRNGTAIETDHGGKYFFNNVNLTGHTLFILGIRNLTNSDRGPYLCQAGSEYNTSEDMIPVWILEDFGRPTTGPPTIEPPIDKVDDSSKAVKIGVGLAVAIVLFAVVTVVAGIYYKFYYKKGSHDISQEGGPSRGPAAVLPRYAPAPGTNGAVTSGAGRGGGSQGEAVAVDNSSVGGGSVFSSPRDGEEMDELPPQWGSDDDETGASKGVPFEVAYPRKRTG